MALICPEKKAITLLKSVKAFYDNSKTYVVSSIERFSAKVPTSDIIQPSAAPRYLTPVLFLYL
jgi:hypothetical protein